MGSTEPVPFTHHAQAQTTFKPPLIANENAYLGDIATSQSADPKAPITSGFYRLEKGMYAIHPSHPYAMKLTCPTLIFPGTPLVYEYHYHEMKIIVDGHFYISDETGQKVKAEKGDVFYFPNGSKITFETDDFGLAFYTGQREEGTA